MLAIFATVKNEAASILEWLAFHKLQGFEYFVLGLDDCTDATITLIQNSQFAGNCRLVAMQDVSFEDPSDKQTAFFMHAINILKEQDVEWAIPVDLDEYVYSPQGLNLADILSEYPQAGVIVCERVFGTSGLATRPADTLVIEAFTKHVKDDLSLSKSNCSECTSTLVDPGFFKVFVRPQQVLSYVNSHFPLTKTRFVYEDETTYRKSKFSGRTKYRPMDILRINHYFTQDRAHWEAKITKGRISGSPRYSEELFEIYNQADVEDLYLKNTWAANVKNLLNGS